MAEKKSIWNDAAVPGLVLGGVAAVYFIINTLTSRIDPDNMAATLMGSGAVMILWLVKFILCIWLMKRFMKAQSARYPEASNNDIFRFGCAVALLSAIVYSAVYLATVEFITPDVFDKALDVIRESPMITSDAMDQIEQMIPKLPAMTFFWNLFYCWIFGTVLSAILSRNIPSSNPFENQN